jgi:hypothetical protein
VIDLRKRLLRRTTLFFLILVAANAFQGDWLTVALCTAGVIAAGWDA